MRFAFGAFEFLFLSMCTALNFGCFRWGTMGDILNSILSLIIATLLVGFTVFVAVFYNRRKNYTRILAGDLDFNLKFGNILEGFNFKRKGKLVFFYITSSLFRKISLAYVLVFEQKKPVFSIFFITV